jgi:3-dehydroquinate dehydratase type I
MVASRAVAVIASAAEFERALRLRRLPDLFELRLDCFANVADQVAAKIERLRAPAIITARHPAEGGAYALDMRARRQLLLRFLPFAAFVDIELRSLDALEDVVAAATGQRVRLILSLHDLNDTPDPAALLDVAKSASAAGAHIFKVATRTDNKEQLHRLLAFFDMKPPRLAVSAMGIGRLGRQSRYALARQGSALNYAHLGDAAVDSQLSLSALRSILHRL